MKKGAEAVVEIEENSVLKTRVEKDYRDEELDQRLRKQRTDSEIKMMQEAAKYGANVPEVERTGEYILEIELIEGTLLKKGVEHDASPLEKLGLNVSRIHSRDIIHGDLTTSNAIVDENNELWLIDFGLSFRSSRVEDKAVDIHLLKQVLESSHPAVFSEAWNNFLDGYSEYSDSERVLEQLEEVEKRGRYL